MEWPHNSVESKANVFVSMSLMAFVSHYLYRRPTFRLANLSIEIFEVVEFLKNEPFCGFYA